VQGLQVCVCVCVCVRVCVRRVWFLIFNLDTAPLCCWEFPGNYIRISY
jgi:hypothetical protein